MPTYKNLIASLTFASAIVGFLVINFAVLSRNNPSLYPLLIFNNISYFTIQSNLIVALVCYSSLTKNWLSHRSWFPVLAFGASVNIAVTGIIYLLILQFTWNPQGLDLFANVLLHYVTPVLYIWYWFWERFVTSVRAVSIWITYPIVYLVYSLFRGSLDSFYPYPFLDVNQHGLQQVIANSVNIAIVFISIGAGLLFIKRLIGRSATLQELQSNKIDL